MPNVPMERLAKEIIGLSRLVLGLGGGPKCFFQPVERRNDLPSRPSGSTFVRPMGSFRQRSLCHCGQVISPLSEGNHRKTMSALRAPGAS